MKIIMRNRKSAFAITVFLFCCQLILAQEKTVTGVVTDADDGMPLPYLSKSNRANC